MFLSIIWCFQKYLIIRLKNCIADIFQNIYTCVCLCVVPQLLKYYFRNKEKNQYEYQTETFQLIC